MKNTYTTEQIKAVGAKLRRMPTIDKNKREHSKQETIEMLAKDIGALRKRGYTYDQIAAALSAEGIPISTSTLKNCLDRAKAKAHPTSADETTSTSASSITTTEAAPSAIPAAVEKPAIEAPAQAST